MKPSKKEPQVPLVNLDNSTSHFTHEAISTFKDPKTGMWYVVTIKFDPQTLQVGDVTSENTHAMDRLAAQEYFKIKTVNSVDCFIGP